MTVTVAALIIFDGWGIRHSREANAIALAHTPVIDRLYASLPHTELDASGEAVGLPPGVMGNSEVGHLTIGAGRLIYQDVMRINQAIETGEFARNPVLIDAIRRAAQAHRTLHLWGLLSDGAVHSHIEHLFALLDLAARNGQPPVAIHAALDGRDKPPRSALEFIDKLEAKLEEIRLGRIATVAGRYYAMDRDQRWDRTERAWRAIVEAEGIPAPTARGAVELAYEEDQSDEFVEPRIVGERAPLADGDQVICFNFRADRARQLTAALALDDFAGFSRPRRPKGGYVCLTEYDRTFGLPIAFAPQDVGNTLGEVLARAGIRNLRVAETEKYAHVTYFLNGGAEKPFSTEERALIQSSKVATYDLEPEMKAAAVAERAAEAIGSGRYGVVIVNFANLDMVGHSGKLDATIKAVETVDSALGVVIEALERRDGAALITADHGNAELMADRATGQPHTAHTTNPVPLILFDRRFKGQLRKGGSLADVTPTLLAMMGLPAPAEMTGRDLRIAAKGG